MTPTELVAKCDRQISICGEDGAEVLLLLPGKWGKRDTRRLVKGDQRAPVGEIVEDNFDGRGLRVLFKAKDVRGYVMAAIREAYSNINPKESAPESEGENED